MGGSSAGSSAFPPSLPPEGGPDAAMVFDEEPPSESGFHAVAPTVALEVADPKLRDLLSVLLQGAGRLPGGTDILSVAAVVVTDARAGAKHAVAGLRARTRSGAAIIVIVPDSAPAAEVNAAYQAGAVLCLRVPVDEHQFLAAIASAIDLHAAKAHADDLLRQLDVQTHLAALGRVTAGFTHEVSNPLAVLCANFEAVRENMEWLLQARDLLARPTAAANTVAPERMSRVCPGDVRAALGDMATALERIKGVLALTRSIAQERRNLRIEDVDLASVVHDVRHWAATELQGVEVQELIDEPLVVRADRRLIGQIVLNLATNAAHAARLLPSPRVRLHVVRPARTRSSTRLAA